MIRLPDAMLDSLLADDAPFGDLTTRALGIGAGRGGSFLPPAVR